MVISCKRIDRIQAVALSKAVYTQVQCIFQIMGSSVSDKEVHQVYRGLLYVWRTQRVYMTSQYIQALTGVDLRQV